MSLSAKIDAQLDCLRTFLKRLQPGLIAVSGGVDSRLLIHAAWQWRLNFQAVHAVGPHQSGRERQAALAWLNAQGGPVQIVDFDPLALPQVQTNSPRRCYYCKHTLFSRICNLAVAQSLATILDGTQADDLYGYRPGGQALQELGVQSPLARIGMGKAAIRQAAKKLGLTEPGQASRSCLLTRFPYDHTVSRQQLAAVGQVEDHLSRLGLRHFRFRVLGGQAYLLQIHNREQAVWQAVQEQASALIADHGLVPFDVMETEHLSGFFDKERPYGQ